MDCIDLLLRVRKRIISPPPPYLLVPNVFVGNASAAKLLLGVKQELLGSGVPKLELGNQ